MAAPAEIALGTFKVKGDDAVQAVAHALRIGYRHIDTAAVYRNEAEVGQAVTAAVEDGVIRSRSEVHITTKLTPKAHVSLEAAEAELQGCLARLNVGAGVDTVLIHWPGTGGRPREDADNAQRRLVTWRMLLAAQSHGQAAALGVSNYTVAHLSEIEAAGLPLPSVNQVELHPRLQQHELRRWCAERHVAVQAYSPLGCGALLADATVCHVAKKHGVEPATVLIRWLVEQGIPMAIKSATPARIASNFEAATRASPLLDEDDWQRLNALEDGHHYCWDPTWVA